MGDRDKTDLKHPGKANRDRGQDIATFPLFWLLLTAFTTRGKHGTKGGEQEEVGGRDKSATSARTPLAEK